MHDTISKIGKLHRFIAKKNNHYNQDNYLPAASKGMSFSSRYCKEI